MTHTLYGIHAPNQHDYFVALFLSFVVLCLLSESAIALQTNGGTGRQEFDIYRNNKRVGSHALERTRLADDITKVTVETEIVVKFLGIRVYEFNYSAEEYWDDKGLKSLYVKQDGSRSSSYLKGKRNGNVFEWWTADRHEVAPLPVFPTNHWKAEVLDQGTVLNTLTGKINRIRVKKVGQEEWEADSSRFTTNRYQYRGDLELDTWYDDHGTWVGMRFNHDDGSTIEYLCRNCRSTLRM